VLAKVHSIANTDTTVLIEGESGTGKELIARQIHATSYRSKGPFVAFSCAALPADLIESELFGHEAGAFTGATQKRLGRFEQAQDGTLFLDDIDDIPLPLQVKLVRVLQEHTFERVGGERSMRTNARILASTKKTLADLVAAGQFRQDLYYRINVVPIQIPPLRDRSADIPLLTAYFLEKAGLEMNRSPVQITAGALKRLCAYSWPGNVRQLEHYVSRMVALTAKDLLDEADLPELEGHSARKPLVSLSLQEIEKIDMNATLAEVEERLILWAMTQAKGNLAKAAEALGIPRSTLQYKLQKK
jgi:DNA-binding NtrC family response regulator